MSYFKVKNILIPLDFSKTSLKALDHAVYLSKLTSAQITLMHAVESIPLEMEPGYFDAVSSVKVFDNFDKEIKSQSDLHLLHIAERIRKKGAFKVNTKTVLGRTHKAILNTAKEMSADLIVMGTHGVSGIRELFIGSNTFGVIKDAACPVLSIQKQSKLPGFKNILVPFRDKPHSREKVDYAIAIAEIFKARIHVLAVDTDFSKSTIKKLILETEQIKNILEESGIDCTAKVISDAYIPETTLKYAKVIDADLIISMADLDRLNITEYFTGPYAQQIVNHSPIPILNIRPSFNTDTIDLRFY